MTFAVKISTILVANVAKYFYFAVKAVVWRCISTVTLAEFYAKKGSERVRVRRLTVRWWTTLRYHYAFTCSIILARMLHPLILPSMLSITLLMCPTVTVALDAPFTGEQHRQWQRMTFRDSLTLDWAKFVASVQKLQCLLREEKQLCFNGVWIVEIRGSYRWQFNACLPACLP